MLQAPWLEVFSFGNYWNADRVYTSIILKRFLASGISALPATLKDLWLLLKENL